MDEEEFHSNTQTTGLDDAALNEMFERNAPLRVLNSFLMERNVVDVDIRAMRWFDKNGQPLPGTPDPCDWNKDSGPPIDVMSWAAYQRAVVAERAKSANSMQQPGGAIELLLHQELDTHHE